MSNVLVVDDEHRIRTLMTRSLTVEGHRVVTADDGFAALEQLAAESFDLVLLDLIMPRCNGLAVLSLMNELGDSTPVIVLSGVTEVGTRVQALERGAVDVVAKPFSLVELLARTRRHLSTTKPAQREQREQRYLEAGGIRLDLDRRCARIRSREVLLSEREFSLLAHLMRRRGEVCSREELLRDVWGLTFDPGSNVVEVAVRRLRAKLEPDPPIETIRRVGYYFSGS
ncbi:response regulator transcription factor [Cellulomonas sp. KRMCY2]|uniref:response regulator transcription factor n=1 Tax=Cellulomonas sp. KRMCY2 TaxID=1304865 RepID=UPI00045E8211|nr:response regulator transcription factor [Cellulomonas sp. KRMCY2]